MMKRKRKIYKVIDNFLEDGPFEQLQMLMMGKNFTWFYSPHKVYSKHKKDSIEQNQLYNFQFFHPFYNRLNIRSNYYDQLKPLMSKIDPIFIHRIKANCTPYTEKIRDFDMHTDVGIKCKTAVYYINTNNGYTKFKDGSKVDSVANRIVIFPSHMKHSGSTCSDEKVRVVINLNYVLREDIKHEVLS